jgi:protein gp37
MQKSKIEWTDYTLNPVKGLCPMACTYCYARRIYKRFHWDETLRYVDGWEFEIDKIKTPSRIFVGSTMELFGDWIKPVWRQDIIQIAGANPQHTFIFLTKQPHNLPKHFPDNCWVGVSATNWLQFSAGLGYLAATQASVKFMSFEPLLESIEFDMLQKMLFPRVINWIIIGAETKNGRIVKAFAPKIEWIREIVEAADSAKMPVFLKDNLIPMFEAHDRLSTPEWALDSKRYLRQELPQRFQESPLIY